MFKLRQYHQGTRDLADTCLILGLVAVLLLTLIIGVGHGVLAISPELATGSQP